ncbi:phosphatase PAP2 family protein [Hathewaya limosa]
MSMSTFDEIKNILIHDWNTLIKRGIILISVPIINILYLILNTPREHTTILKMSIDSYIPFMKIFIIPYVIWYVYVAGFLAFLCILDEKQYFRTVFSLNLGMLISYFVFFIFPTHVPRPEVIGTDILSNMVLWIYKTDNPYNCFPSIHVLNTLIINYFVCVSDKFSKNVKIMATIVGVSIILSTLFIKQHYFADVIGGVILAFIVCFIFKHTNFHIYLKNKELKKNKNKKEIFEAKNKEIDEKEH